MVSRVQNVRSRPGSHNPDPSAVSSNIFCFWSTGSNLSTVTCLEISAHTHVGGKFERGP